MLNIFHFAPKPMQVYWGGPVPKGAEVNCIDAIGCRENALVDNDDALPIFSPLDAPELCHDENGNFKHEPMYYDYLYVDIPDGDEKGRFPYTGRRFYWKGAVRYMLAKGKIEPRHLKAGIRATKHHSPSALGEVFKNIKELMVHYVLEVKSWECIAPEDVQPEDIKSGGKAAILGCLGFWSTIEQFRWYKIKSAYESDAGGPVKRRRELEDGQFEFMWSVDLLSLRSMRPIAQIPLDMEQVRIAEILEILKPFEDKKLLTRLGSVVDCVFYESKALVSLQDDVDHARLPSGAPKFKIKREPACKVPTKWTNIPTIRNHDLSFEPPEWENFYDPSMEALVNLIDERRGALVNGAAGTGKTTSMRKAIKMLRRKLKKEGVELRNLNCALRHAAARLIDGSTIAHLLNKYRMQGGPKFAKNCIILIDEASEIPLSMWTELAQWYLLGVRFVIIGDFDGQFLPMFDRWAKALQMTDIQTSLFFHSLCEGTRIHFTQYRRGDAAAKPLFDYYCGLYPLLKNENQDAALAVALEAAQKIFKTCEGMPGTMLCLSHKKRELLNHAVNVSLATDLERSGTATQLIPKTTSKSLGVTMAPQDFKIWVGMELLGCIRQSNSKTIINGVWYVVVRWDDRFVYLVVHERYRKQPGDDTDDEKEVDDEDLDDAENDPAEGEIPEMIKLTYEQASKWLRPMHALCYGSIQGCTMANKSILLLDTTREHFTLRHLIVGVSRATHQDNVHVATEKYEKDLMMFARMHNKQPMVGGTDAFKYNDAEFESDDTDLALYGNDPDESHRVSVLSFLSAVASAPVVANAHDADVDINAFFDDEGVFEDAIDSDVEVDSDGDVVM